MSLQRAVHFWWLKLFVHIFQRFCVWGGNVAEKREVLELTHCYMHTHVCRYLFGRQVYAYAYNMHIGHAYACICVLHANKMCSIAHSTYVSQYLFRSCGYGTSIEDSVGLFSYDVAPACVQTCVSIIILWPQLVLLTQQNRFVAYSWASMCAHARTILFATFFRERWRKEKQTRPYESNSFLQIQTVKCIFYSLDVSDSFSAMHNVIIHFLNEGKFEKSILIFRKANFGKNVTKVTYPFHIMV